MGHHGVHDKIEVPDYRSYNVEDVPKLLETKKRLAALGLKDPWLRNEVWRYQLRKDDPTSLRTLQRFFVSGFKYGIVIAIVATLISKQFARKIEH